MTATSHKEKEFLDDEHSADEELLRQDVDIFARFVLGHPKFLRFYLEETDAFQRQGSISVRGMEGIPAKLSAWLAPTPQGEAARQNVREKKGYHEYIQNIKSQLCCVDCGQQHPATLHFHHLNSEDKVFDISYAANRGFSLDRIKKEIEKCIILCANCHAIRHYNMRKKNQTSPGIAGELEELNTLLAISSEEEDAYNIPFGEGSEFN